MNKILIGKKDVLFLCNDASKELEVHCENLFIVNENNLSRYSFPDFMMFVYPDKSFFYKDFLPDGYIAQYRPGLAVYKDTLQDALVDLYDILKDETDVYYKTDTHINQKGNYIVYKHFLSTLEKKLNIHIEPKVIEFEVKKTQLSSLDCGLGDLTWKSNTGDIILDNIEDTYYYHPECCWFYCSYKIKKNVALHFLDYQFKDKTSELENLVVNWDIIINHIIYVKNENKYPGKVIFFYDSFLLHSLPLYFDLFEEAYFVKHVYSKDIIDTIQPTHVFEFRIERFLF